MSRAIVLYAAPDGTQVRDLTAQVRTARLTTNARGVGDLAVEVAAPSMTERVRLATRVGAMELRAGDGAQWIDARLEGAPIAGGETVQLTGYGYGRAFADVPYTALWSDDSVAGWRVLRGNERATAYPDRYTFDNQNRLYFAPQKNATLGNTAGDKGLWYGYQTPDVSSRTIVGAQFSYEFSAGVTWTANLRTFANFTAASTLIWTQAAGAAATTGAMHLTFTGAAACGFFYYYSAADALFAGETGTVYFRVTNIRLVTSTTNRVNTTLTAGRTNGAGVTCTVGSTTGMYVGMQLVIGSGGANSEMVIVLSITGATTFTANVVNAGAGYAIGTTVQGFAIYADEIVRDMQSAVITANPAQLNASTALIQSPGFDLTHAIYEDADMTAILNELAALGDTQTTPRIWNWRVMRGRVLVFEPRGASARAWYADVSDEDLEIDLATDQLLTSAYPLYQEPGGRTLRGATLSNADALARYGVTRRSAVPTQTTISAVAAITANAMLADRSRPIPRIKVTIRRVFDSTGAPVPLDVIDAGRGDTLTIRNLAPGLSTDLDRLRTFRITRTDLDLMAGVLVCEAESPPSSMDALLSRGVAVVETVRTRRTEPRIDYVPR